MKDRTGKILGILGFVAMFLFVGIATNLNVLDTLDGGNRAYWFNIVGFCLVPILAVIVLWGYRKMVIRHKKVDDRI